MKGYLTVILFGLSGDFAYELIPTTDKQILQIDAMIND